MTSQHTMTTSQRRALRILAHNAGHVIAPGRPITGKQITYKTAERLVVAGYARPIPHNPVDLPNILALIIITKQGRAALNRPVPETPVYLRERDGLTTEASRSVRSEGEVVDPHTLDGWWQQQAALRKADAQDRRTRAARHRDIARTTQ